MLTIMLTCINNLDIKGYICGLNYVNVYTIVVTKVKAYSFIGE